MAGFNPFSGGVSMHMIIANGKSQIEPKPNMTKNFFYILMIG